MALLNAPDVDSDPITGDLLPETDPATPDPADVIEAQQRHILALERRIDMAAAAAASVTALPATLPAPVVSAEPNQLAVPDPAPKPDGNPIYPDWNASQLERRLRVEQGFAVVASKRNGADGKPIDAALIAWADQQNLMTPIDRSSAWGNPFEMPTDGDRNEVCDRFVEFLTAKPSLLKKIPTLKGKVLVCWCHPERCHGDHLAELANDPAPHHAWYTPGEYIEAARAVMGGIDLDPASCEVAQATVQAVRFFSKEQDGLAQLWQGRVWLNPPFETGAIDRFVAKLIADFKSGAIAQAVILTDSATDTRWFHDLANAARLVCFTKGRISFNSPITDSKNPQRGQAFTYFGDRPAAFAARFKDFGLVVAVQA